MIRRGLILLALLGFMSFGTIAMTQSVGAQSGGQSNSCDSKGMILTLKPWYYGLTEADCSIKSPGGSEDSQKAFVTRIVLTIVEDLLQVAAYITIGYIIYGGFIYLTSGGSSDRAARGMKTVMNAAIGLVIAMASIGLVNFIAGYLGV